LLKSAVSASNGNFVTTNFGPVSVSQAFASAPSMAAVLNFVLTSPDSDGSAAFTGQLELTAAAVSSPEPATMALFGFGLIGLAALAKRFHHA